MGEAEKLGDKLGILNDGIIACEGTSHYLK